MMTSQMQRAFLSLAVLALTLINVNACVCAVLCAYAFSYVPEWNAKGRSEKRKNACARLKEWQNSKHGLLMVYSIYISYTWNCVCMFLFVCICVVLCDQGGQQECIIVIIVIIHILKLMN